MLVDAHIHLDWSKETFTALEKARKAGVKEFLAMGMDSMNNYRAVLFAKQAKDIKPCSGLYFEVPYRYSDKQIDEEIKNIRKDKNKIFAIGEIGLDKHWHKKAGLDKQKKLFKKMMKLAQDLRKPLIVHSRDAEKEVLDALKGYKGRVLLHCFTGPKNLAAEGVARGYYFSINPVVLRYPEVEEIVKIVPLNLLLAESDFPYSGYGPKVIDEIIAKIAEIKGLKKADVEKAVWNNYKKFIS